MLYPAVIGKEEMVDYKIIKKDNSIWTFNYWVEGKGEKGTLAYNSETGERIILDWSPDDPFHTYGGHVWQGFDYLIENKEEVKDEGYFMWY